MFSDYWLGGRDDVIEGFWQWSSTGENFTVSDWAPGEPDDAANSQDCLLIWKAADYQWDDQQCTINYRYICESEVCGLSIFSSSILLIILPTCIQSSQYALVMVIRLLQGLVEGPAYSSINGVISAWSLKSEKSRMVTLTYAGSSLSSAVAFIVSGALSCRVCWNAPFYFYGCLGIIWSTLFMCTVKDSPSNNTHLSTSERLLFDSERAKTKKPSSQTVKGIPWKNILTSVPVSAIFVACFTRNWMISLVRTVVPQYMEDLFDLSIFEIGLLSSLSAICMALVTVTGGVLIDKLIKFGFVSTTVGRKIAQCSGYGIEGVCIFCLGYIQDIDAAMVMLCVGVGASGLAVSGFKSNSLDLSSTYVSIVTGITRMGITGATISTLLVSLLRSRLEVSFITTWREVFMVAGCLHIAGVIYYGIFASGTLICRCELENKTLQLVGSNHDGYSAVKSKSTINNSCDTFS
ncbi:SLC17A6_7_8 [Mytilus edulis]|uniref:SLC17A6_7_8 n=1 Tax=Mytilus edulis TaxID=6550 RepID=A0A8S3SWB6_MYTED|nr:SLC17A6_7_8 [Mytilus edulis]